MSNYLDALFIEANNSWDLKRLYKDLRLIKGRGLTPFEKACLRGFLCSFKPQNIAKEIDWDAASLRTQLSRQVYPLLYDLLGKDKLHWDQIASWLEQKGYKRSVQLKAGLETISKKPTIRASQIINSIESKLVKHLDSSIPREDKLSLSESELESVIAQGNKDSEQGDYLQALKSYWLVLEEAFLLFPGCLVQVAACYDKLGAFKDCAEICYFALERKHIHKNEGLTQCYTFLAGAFHELCLHTCNSSDLEQSLYFYECAIDCEPGNVLPAWNIVDVLVSFSKNKPEKTDQYVTKARLAFAKLQNKASAPESNFYKYKYRIFKNAKHLICELKNESLKNQIQGFLQK